MDLFNLADGYEDTASALAKIQCPVLVLGSQTDILFPIWQQKQLAEELIQTGERSRRIRCRVLSFLLSQEIQM